MDTPSEVSALTPRKRDAEQHVLSAKEAEGGRDWSTWFTLLRDSADFHLADTWGINTSLANVICLAGLLPSVQGSKDMF